MIRIILVVSPLFITVEWALPNAISSVIAYELIIIFIIFEILVRLILLIVFLR